MLDWKLNNVEPQGSSDGFWYDITNGYIRPNILLADKSQLEMVNDAINVLISLQETLEKHNLLNEF